MKIYSSNFQKNFHIIDLATQISGYNSMRENFNVLFLGSKIYNAEPISQDDINDIQNFIGHLLTWDKYFRSDKNRVNAALWLLDAMDDDCEELSDYEADIKDKSKKYYL